MYLTPIRLLSSLIAIVAIASIFTTGTAAVIKSVLAQSESSAFTTTIQSPSSGQKFSAIMTGDKEVPPVSTDTTGTIRVQSNSQQQTLDYDLTLTNLNGVITGAHIHMGKPGVNGPIVADLNAPGLGGAAAASSSSSSSGGGTAMTSNSVSGTIRSTDLKGPLEGKQITDLVKLIQEGRAYTNVHTEQNPNGEIRGQLLPSSSDITSTDNTGSTSASTSQSPSASASATAP
jgi:CHRD domain-containing protein